MFSNHEDLYRFIKEKRIETVDLKFVDLFGRWHHITIPAKRLNQELFNIGVAFDGSSVPGFKTVGSGDMVLMPDIITAMIEPFWESKTLSFICNICEADTRKWFYRCPRSIIQKTEEYLIQTGIADESHWGPEFEFYIFNNVNYDNGVNYSHYYIDSDEGEWNSAIPENNLAYQLPLQGGYHAIPPNDKLYDIRNEMSQLIEKAGIPIRYHHHEVGGPGQVEIETMMGPLLKMADAVMLIKYIIRMVAYRHNKTITFMPKPLYNIAGNGMHFHQNLFKDGEPIFYDENNYAGLSKTAEYYIGGVLKHGRALLALTNPSTNSYKRLIPGFEAPVNLFYSLGNRSAAIRVPKYANTPETKRFEFRPPDATCNPYLAMSAMLLAGIDGIKNKIEPREHNMGPFDGNLFDAPKKLLNKIVPVPASLKEALEALEKDHKFLLEGDVFTKDMIKIWIEEKMKEYNEMQNRPHPYELKLYYDM